MRAVLQRVSSAEVSVNSQIVGSIEEGLMAYLGFGHDDTETSIEKLVEKVSKLRMFSNDRGNFDLSLLDVGGELLLVPQFTLFADTTGRRPSFFEAATPRIAEGLFLFAVKQFSASGIPKVESGIFGAHMSVQSVNNGPVTILLDDKI
ncbi:MAG TPA: D-tyrosyl-tRNA(Tyr) deacylase [Dehalococcoidia bacterium]|jgi:D-tyrosyl-tRNA(Tyr) deacylase|nr:D-tyrosyl-tRNA(Tyr) deacylase [Dehalococcoidia bacterium]